MGKKLITSSRPPKPPKLPDTVEGPAAIPSISEYDPKNLPGDVQKAIQSGMPVINVPPGFIKAQKKAVRAAQKAARKAEKKAGLKSGPLFGAPQSRTSTTSATQNASGLFLVREIKRASGRKGFIPYIVVVILVALIVAHEYGVF